MQSGNGESTWASYPKPQLDAEAIRARLLSPGLTRFISVGQVIYSFHGFRDTQDPHTEDMQVRVEILDYGPSKELARYCCRAVRADGKEAWGNPAPDIERAIAGCHWQELDHK